MKQSILIFLATCFTVAIFGLFVGCKKTEKCEVWIYNRLVTDIQPGCAVTASEYNLKAEVCGEELSNAREHATVIQSKNSCYTERIQYVQQAN